MRMQAAASAAVDPALLPAEASARARSVAERQAKLAVDRSGRQRIEERLAEVVIRNIRAQRNRARKERQAQRDGTARQALAQQALVLARQATGRSAEEASSPVQLQQLDQQDQQQQVVVVGAAVPSSGMPNSAFALTAADKEANELVPTALGYTTPASSPPASGNGGNGSTDLSNATPLHFAPRPMMPGTRVTVGNLSKLLKPQGLDRSSSQSSAAGDELGGPSSSLIAPGAPPRSNGLASAAANHPGPLTVADLAKLLSKQAKLG
jgi:hypothetical protein